ncbi:RDD family protein [Rickettsia endosymbiont of Halotydeus destructor]|uniref:RDD family protein n=1 Tax=Rickettsia endosymbiont of Halotydeus destructor TaxID=2996754 RepID=UPI003BAF8182
MKKQIIYPKLIPRIFCTALDLALLSLITFPILHFCSSWLMVFFYKDYFIKYNIELYNYANMFVATIRPEFFAYLKLGNFNKYIFYNISMLITNLTVIGSYFVGFWYYKGATPSKMIMHMKIVDAITFAKPTLWQLIRRFLGYMTFPFGIWLILFSSQKQALHDKIAGTVVIKN